MAVAITCSNIDFTEISPKSLAFSAKAFEIAFNGVHKHVDGLALNHVVSTGPLPLFTDSKIRGGVAQCHLCGRDDEIMAPLTFVASGAGLAQCDHCGRDEEFYAKLEQCHYCGRDDELAPAGRELHQALEEEFTILLASSRHSALQDARDCKVKMTDRKASIAAEEDAAANRKINMDVQCDNTDWSDLSIHSLSYSSKALQDSYNAVFKATDGYIMENVYLAGHRLRVGTDIEQGCKHCVGDEWITQCHYCGRDDMVVQSSPIEFAAKLNQCHLCGRDDATENKLTQCHLCGRDDDFFANVKKNAKMTYDSASTKAHKAWEDAFLARLVKDPVFKHVSQCSIKVGSGKTVAQQA
jgi:ribosomal protein S14